MDELAETRFAKLCAAQHHVATRQQLRSAGMSESALRAQVGADRWRSLNDRVVVMHNGPLSHPQQMWAVILSVEGLVALCGLSSLAEAGLRNHDDEQIHVLVVRGAKVLATPGIARHVHESRRFIEPDVVVRNGMPCTPVERSAIDAAAWSPHPKRAASLLADVVQQRLTTAARLLAVLETVGQVKHRRMMGLLLTDIAGGAQALSELELLRFCRRHGFPRPQMQWRRDSAGRRRYLDARFKRRRGGHFTVEVDGGVHLRLIVRWTDTAKDNDDVLDGRTFLRFPSVAIYLDDPIAVTQIRRALEAPLMSDAIVALAT